MYRAILARSSHNVPTAIPGTATIVAITILSGVNQPSNSPARSSPNSRGVAINKQSSNKNPIRIRPRPAASVLAPSATRTATPAVTTQANNPHTSKHSTKGVGGCSASPVRTVTVSSPSSRINAPTAQPTSAARPKPSSEIGGSNATATARGDVYKTPNSE